MIVCVKTDIPAAAGIRIADITAWQETFDGLAGRMAARFARRGTCDLAGDVIKGMLAELPRTNGWTVAEYLGHPGPDRVQSLLSDAAWDHDGVRDDLRAYVIDHLGTNDSVLLIDETGDLKKGTKTVGVQRQYTGTAGRIENSQVAVYLVWATPKGATFTDRALYLPESWTSDPARMARAGVPEGTVFATKPAQAAGMIAASIKAGYTPGRVSADEVYGGNPGLRTFLHDHQIPYVMAVKRTELVTTTAGVFPAIDLAVRPTVPYTRLSAGKGAHGERDYDWALVHLEPPPGRTGMFTLLVRRSITPKDDGTHELAFYLTYYPQPVALVELVHVAGTRWRIEEGFQTGKELAGLDEHQVRTWTSWHRWTILAMAAHALLTIITADQDPPEAGLAPLTRNEARRLATRILWAVVHTVEHILAWSTWRRRRLHAARISHYKRQGDKLPP